MPFYLFIDIAQVCFKEGCLIIKTFNKLKKHRYPELLNSYKKTLMRTVSTKRGSELLYLVHLFVLFNHSVVMLFVYNFDLDQTTFCE